MFGIWTYLTWLLLFVGLPLLVLGCRYGWLWWRERRALGWTLAGAAVGGWVWDYAAIQLGYWSFHRGNLLGVNFLGLPLEEWLWILGVTLLFAGITLIIAEKSPHRKKCIQGESPLLPRENSAWVLAFLPLSLSQAVTTLLAGVIFHAILWARNSAFLKENWTTLAKVTGLAMCWMLATDPIGAAWGAWIYDPSRVVGIWLFGLIPLEDILGIIVVASVAAAAVLVFAYSPRRWI